MSFRPSTARAGIQAGFLFSWNDQPRSGSDRLCLSTWSGRSRVSTLWLEFFTSFFNDCFLPLRDFPIYRQIRQTNTAVGTIISKNMHLKILAL